MCRGIRARAPEDRGIAVFDWCCLAGSKAPCYRPVCVSRRFPVIINASVPLQRYRHQPQLYDHTKAYTAPSQSASPSAFDCLYPVWSVLAASLVLYTASVGSAPVIPSSNPTSTLSRLQQHRPKCRRERRFFSRYESMRRGANVEVYRSNNLTRRSTGDHPWRQRRRQDQFDEPICTTHPSVDRASFWLSDGASCCGRIKDADEIIFPK